ncbi:MAG: HAMP domain-containing protein, partial [Treponema sp.]|nr:HAMP domain-containing protein [Treponema sp.]
SVVVGYGVCTRMLKPIQRFSSKAREISSGHLDRRFDENGAQDELTELARTFNELFERLEKDFERQKRFTSDAAHELKTPLAVMNGYVDMVRRWGKDDARVLDESLAVLKRELVSMTAFTENLLVLARTENAAHDFERRTFAVKPVLERVRDDCLLHAPAVCCDIICAEDATLVSNEDAVRQMLHIMVQNSIKYSPPPAHVTLSFDGAVIRVTDEGFGIPESAVPHLFDRFYRVDESRNRQQGGAGLGLSIAQALAEKLDIRLAVTSSVGHGTTIALEFK